MNSKPWQSLRQEVKKEIMNTDIMCEIVFPLGQEDEASRCLETAFTMMRTFESRYSRFQKGNELWTLNHSTRLEVSPELFDLLTRCQYFYTHTKGLFDPSILPALEKEGYLGTGDHPISPEKRAFSELTLDQETLTVTKPHDLFIDLGGIGKGYIIDQVAAYLSEHFENFLIDAGGDIYAHGGNKKEGYAYFAIEVEHPDPKHEPALLLLSNMAVATSGRNRRHWKKNGEMKHHLIDPTTLQSALPDFLSVTVIAPHATAADVYAKMLFIAGKEKGRKLAQEQGLPALFIESDHTMTINHHAQKYVWQEK